MGSNEADVYFPLTGTLGSEARGGQRRGPLRQRVSLSGCELRCHPYHSF